MSAEATVKLLRVLAVPGEATRFHVESGTLQCTNPQCGKQYNRRTRHRLNPPERWPTDFLRIGDKCPTCVMRHNQWKKKGREAMLYTDYALEVKEQIAERLSKEEPAIGTLDVRFHLCDIAANHGVGRCSCEYWEFGLAREVERMLPSELAVALATGRKRCSHIEAARQFALDLSIQAHERDRYRLAGRQLEETQP